MEQDGCIAQGLGNRFASRGSQQGTEPGYFVIGQGNKVAVLGLEPCLDQGTAHVLSGPFSLGSDEIEEVDGLADGCLDLGRAGLRLSLLPVQHCVGLESNHLPIGLRDAEDGADDLHREGRGKVLHHVEPVLVHQWVEVATNEDPDLVPVASHGPGSETPAHQPAIAVVLGRVHHDHAAVDARVEVGVDEMLVDQTMGRGEVFGIEVYGRDVREAAEGVEVPPVAVEAGRLLAHAGVGRERVVEELSAEGIEVDAGHGFLRPLRAGPSIPGQSWPPTFRPCQRRCRIQRLGLRRLLAPAGL